MNAQNTVVTALALTILAGAAHADNLSVFVFEPNIITTSPFRCDAVTNDGSGLVISAQVADSSGALRYHTWTWADGVASSLPGSTSPTGDYYDIRLRDVLISSASTGGGGSGGSLFVEACAQVSGPIPGSSLWTSPSSSPLHITSDDGQYTGAFTFTASTSEGRRVFGSTVADLDGDGRPDLAACSWDVSSSSSVSPPTLLQMDPLSDFSFARDASSDGRIVVGTRGRIDRANSLDMTPEEFSQRACLWTDGQLADTSNLDAYASSSFVSVCDDGSTALARCVSSDGTASLVAFDVASSSLHVLDWLDPDSDDDGVPTAMSADGSLIGGSSLHTDGSSVAMLWVRQSDGSYAARTLSSVLDNLGSSGLDGVSFTSVTAVSSNGLTVAGTLTLADGSVRLFSAAVPSPGTLALIGAGGLLAARRRRAH
ncbi:MAG: hypothetical protein D6692_08420 [Planctomycetota bacterium]|nr:MAG: hypothetical protein D6692_08420 [Planctomycetota bacterium]